MSRACSVVQMSVRQQLRGAAAEVGGGSLLNRGLKTVSNFVTWWRWCSGALQHHHNIITLPGSPHHCTTTAVCCRPTCPRLQHTALHCLDQELSIQGTLACSQVLQLSLLFLPVIIRLCSHHCHWVAFYADQVVPPGSDCRTLGGGGDPCECLHQGYDRGPCANVGACTDHCTCVHLSLVYNKQSNNLPRAFHDYVSNTIACTQVTLDLRQIFCESPYSPSHTLNYYTTQYLHTHKKNYMEVFLTYEPLVML